MTDEERPALGSGGINDESSPIGRSTPTVVKRVSGHIIAATRFEPGAGPSTPRSGDERPRWGVLLQPDGEENQAVVILDDTEMLTDSGRLRFQQAYLRAFDEVLHELGVDEWGHLTDAIAAVATREGQNKPVVADNESVFASPSSEIPDEL